MFHTHAKYLLIVLLITGGVRLSAQTTTSSGTNTSNPNNGHENDPYSKYGIGELQNGNNTVLRGMGNITSAYENAYSVNSDNPASYSFLKFTTYEAGFTASTRSINAIGQTYTTGTASISYLNLGIPVGKNAGLCFGFKPYSHTYYSLADTLANSPIGNAVRSYSGEGGLNYAYIGGAYRYKGLSLGVNVGYMFGTISDITAVQPIDTLPQNRAYTTQYSNYNRIGGIYWKAGLMYEKKIDSDYTINVGGTITLQQNLSQRLNAFQITGYNFGDTIINDTVSYPGEQQGKIKLPMSYSIGVILTKNDKWSVGADYTATKWSQYNSALDPTMNLGIASSSYKASIGGEYTPDINNVRSYFSRVTYRFGAYYGTDYLDISNTQLPIYGLTAGASLPFRRSLSKVHIALDLGRLGTTTNNLTQETYIRFSLGFSFCDRWFIQHRYD
jgi:hypothetical protein